MARQRVEVVSCGTCHCRAALQYCRGLAGAPTIRDLAEPGFVLIDRAGQLVANQNVSGSDLRWSPVGRSAGAAMLIDALTDRPDLQKRIIAAVAAEDAGICALAMVPM